jgi:hypothetical protein
MAKNPKEPVLSGKVYTLTILDSDGEEIYRKSMPVESIDKANFTQYHKVRALINAFSK